MSKENYKENNKRMDIIGQNGNDGLHYPESDRKIVWEGKYVTVGLVDTTTECFIQEGVYSLTQMIDLYEELADAFGVTIKELKKLDHDVTYSEQMQNKLEPIE